MSENRRNERMSVIMTLLTRYGEVEVHTLPALLNVSGPTVRRDLALMEEKGLLLRSYGKIAAARQSAEMPVSFRHARNTEAKQRIGALASSLIPHRPLTLALSGGSTVRFVAQHLAGRAGLTVVTNGLDTVDSLLTRQLVQVVVTGGQARPSSRELVGRGAERTLRSYRFDYVVIGVDGISPEKGLTRHSDRGAEVDRVMLEQADHAIVVADSSKIGRVHRAKIADTVAVDNIVTDSHANAGVVARLRDSGVTTTLVVVPPLKPGALPRAR
ncbi:DeoR/GlpR family DNA-binding transcription regulator [Streptomyces sp. NPDC048636]|uniref:DeoR/GlpR family DNA-binding transcription regulator n=1 Tax=Streptomyces sp. NPDC048636 TaxID=3155762 RepID=UPI00343110DF